MQSLSILEETSKRPHIEPFKLDDNSFIPLAIFNVERVGARWLYGWGGGEPPKIQIVHRLGILIVAVEPNYFTP